MTHTNQTVNSIGTGSRFSYAAAGDSYFVARGVTVRSTDAACITGSAGGYRLEINGLVESLANSGARLFGGGVSVVIGEQGTLRSANHTLAGNGHLFLTGGNGDVTNHGKLIAETCIALLANGDSYDVFNDGTIKGASGVFFSGTGSRFENAGDVISSTFDDLNQSSNFNNAVFVDSTDSQIINRRQGSISAVSERRRRRGCGRRWRGRHQPGPDIIHVLVRSGLLQHGCRW